MRVAVSLPQIRNVHVAVIADPIGEPIAFFLVKHTSELRGILWVVFIKAQLSKARIVDRVYLPQTTVRRSVSIIGIVSVRLKP